jgi:hypothetical protein
MLISQITTSQLHLLLTFPAMMDTGITKELHQSISKVLDPVMINL